MTNHPLRETEAAKRASTVLRTLRERRGLTAKQLASSLGVDVNTIYRWENQRLPYASVILINWLTSEKGGDVYWRERALLAESSMRKMSQDLIKYNKALKVMNDS